MVTPKIIGYARVSTKNQDVAAQVAELEAAGCHQVFSESISTTQANRPQLQAVLAILDPGDELVLVKLDRLGRTQVEVINILADLQQQGIHVRTLDGFINTKALGVMAPVMVGLITGLAEVERTLIQERTRASVAYRRATGGNLGGRPKTWGPRTAETARYWKGQGLSYREIAQVMRYPLATVQRMLRHVD